VRGGGAGTVVLNCGGGKTVLATYLMAALGVKTMVVVHKEFLMTQWAERIAQFLPACSVGRVQGPLVDVEGRDIVMVSLKSLTMRDYGAALDGFGLVVYDECHHMAARVFCLALHKTNFRYVLGLTATPDRKDGLHFVFKWFLGDVVWQPEAGERRPDVRVRLVSHAHTIAPMTAFNGTMDRVGMVGALCAHPERTRTVCDLVAAVLARDPARCVLLLSDRRRQLDDMHALLQALGVDRVGFYVGGMKAAARAVTETQMRVILATFSMASEGMDIPRLDTLVLCSPKSDVVQSVGRILRRPGNAATVYDVLDAHFEGAARARRQHYASAGFTVGAHE
jgi:superfamily II DNA or RNA helicase